MTTIVVVDNPARWKLAIAGVEVVAARAYLTDPAWAQLRRARVFNLCRSYRYQTTGYYVSLLANARRHRVLPAVSTLQDMRSAVMVRVTGEQLDGLIQRALAPLRSDRFELSIYFGRNVAKRYDRLAQALFNSMAAPLLRAHFEREGGEGGRWSLVRLAPIPAADVP
jgi:hypothetical protein